jgi:hypothetical protein
MFTSKFLNRVLGREKPSEPKFSENAKFATLVDVKAEANALIKVFKGGARTLPVNSVDPAVLRFLSEKGLITVGESHEDNRVSRFATIDPNVFMCQKCDKFSGRKDQNHYAQCRVKGDLVMPGINTTKARSCSDFYLAVLSEAL